MRVVNRVVWIALLWTGLLVVPAVAQEAPTVDARSTVQISSEETDRAAVRDFLARPEVQRAAEFGGVDLERIQEELPRLDGEQLQRVATQARAIDNQLGEPSADRTMTFRVTTIIIILLAVIIVILLV